MQFMNGSQGVAAQHLYALNKIQDGFVTWPGTSGNCDKMMTWVQEDDYRMTRR